MAQIVRSVEFFTKRLRRLIIFLTNLFRNRFLYKLRFSGGRFIVKMLAAVIAAYFTFKAEGIRKRIVFPI